MQTPVNRPGIVNWHAREAIRNAPPTLKLVSDSLARIRSLQSLDGFESNVLELSLDLLDRVAIPLFVWLSNNLLIQPPRINVSVEKSLHVVNKNLTMVALIPLVPLDNAIKVISAIHKRFDVLPAGVNIVPGSDPKVLRTNSVAHEMASETSNTKLSCLGCLAQGLQRFCKAVMLGQEP